MIRTRRTRFFCQIPSRPHQTEFIKRATWQASVRMDSYICMDDQIPRSRAGDIALNSVKSKLRYMQ